ncbi:MAG TPA: hypothetical protein VFB33_01690 [Candidatus Binataceae bacterium]|nr:hypothetical protein [Candidatus Binataceae bacterium]
MAANRLTSLSSAAHSLFWEYRLGISTRGRYGEGDALSGEHRYYATVPYSAIFEILDRLSLKPDDVFVDLGSGKGRAVCCAATYNIQRAIGVEDVGVLHELAALNVGRLRRARAATSLIRAKAQEFDFTQGTVFYLFNPFGPETLREVLAKMEHGLAAGPRRARIVYVNPVHEEVLAARTWLIRAASWQLRGLKWPISVWQTRKAGEPVVDIKR